MSIEIDDYGWRTKLAKYSAFTRTMMTDALNEEWPLLIGLIIRLTPPKTLAQGRAAVNRDIRKTMRPFDPAAIRTEGIQEIVDRKDIEAYNIVAQRIKSGPMAGTYAVPFSPEQHTHYRNRLGKIGTGTRGRAVVLGSDAGLLKKYIREVQNRVGWAKSGWLAALHLVGAKPAPGFVERHGEGGGAVIDERKDPEYPSITAINRTPWAARRDEGQRIIKDAIDSREISIENKIKTKMRLARQQAGFDTAA